MEKKVTMIPASLNRFSSEPIAVMKRRKTAGYARVSTDREEQATSYEAQMRYYKEYIESRADWEFVGMYSDEGISATSTAHREGFNQMVEDALDGKIELIITKSVSRFARNTVDSLTTIRKLKDRGVEVFFEKENIWTFDSKGELLITIMSSLAQEESRSISENTTWGRRKRFAEGISNTSCSNLLGYDQDPDGGMRVNREEAKTVRQIYKWFLEGYACSTIAKKLTAQGIPSPMGKPSWCATTVTSILRNEKYKGDALLQKYYTTDFLTKKRKKNEGELPQYYVKDDHEPIIDEVIFDLVQAEFLRRKSMGSSHYSGVSVFSSKIKCGECGGWYGPKVWHSNDQYRKIVYRCNRKYEDGQKCGTPHLTEEEIRRLFVRAVNQLLDDKDELLRNADFMKEVSCDTSKLEKELNDLDAEIKALVGKINDMIGENARVAKDQEEYQQEYEELMEEYKEKKQRSEELADEITEKRAEAKQFDNFIVTLQGMNGFCEEFDGSLWGSLLEYATVYAKDDVRFTFRGGTEVKVRLA